MKTQTQDDKITEWDKEIKSQQNELKVKIILLQKWKTTTTQSTEETWFKIEIIT